MFQARWLDLVAASARGLEQYIRRLGHALLALAGLVLLARGRLWLAVLLGLAVSLRSCSRSGRTCRSTATSAISPTPFPASWAVSRSPTSRSPLAALAVAGSAIRGPPRRRAALAMLLVAGICWFSISPQRPSCQRCLRPARDGTGGQDHRLLFGLNHFGSIYHPADAEAASERLLDTRSGRRLCSSGA
jgi:hypothetical protein